MLSQTEIDASLESIGSVSLAQGIPVLSNAEVSEYLAKSEYPGCTSRVINAVADIVMAIFPSDPGEVSPSVTSDLLNDAFKRVPLTECNIPDLIDALQEIDLLSPLGGLICEFYSGIESLIRYDEQDPRILAQCVHDFRFGINTYLANSVSSAAYNHASAICLSSLASNSSKYPEPEMIASKLKSITRDIFMFIPKEDYNKIAINASNHRFLIDYFKRILSPQHQLFLQPKTLELFEDIDAILNSDIELTPATMGVLRSIVLLEIGPENRVQNVIFYKILRSHMEAEEARLKVIQSEIETQEEVALNNLEAQLVV